MRAAPARALIVDGVVFVLLLLTLRAPLSPAALERSYANGMFAWMNRTFVPLSNAVPFALGDLMVALVVVVLIAWWIAAIRKPRDRVIRIIAMLVHTAALAARSQSCSNSPGAGTTGACRS